MYMERDASLPLSPLDFHVLLVLAAGTLYGYAILKEVAAESGGIVHPEIGSLYRVLARLMSIGLVEEAPPPPSAPEVHRGRSRRYYRLTREGKAALKAEVRRLDHALAIARERAILAGGSRS